MGWFTKNTEALPIGNKPTVHPEDSILGELAAETAAGMPKRRAYLEKKRKEQEKKAEEDLLKLQAQEARKKAQIKSTDSQSFVKEESTITSGTMPPGSGVDLVEAQKSGVGPTGINTLFSLKIDQKKK